jgi:signal transduction histidine kinase
MKRRLVLMALAWLLVSTPWAASASAPASQLTAQGSRLSLEGQIEHFVDATNAMPFEAVRQQAFARLPDFRSLGYDAKSHWFRVNLNRAPDAPVHWVLSIGSPDLEEVDVWVALQDGDFRHYALGYHRPYRGRPIPTREFAVPVDVPAATDVYFRVRTNNAINVHAEIWQVTAFSANETQANFYRGLYFGILLIASVLYTIVSARLRDASMGAYAGYLGSQTLLHLGSAGYLPVLLLADAPWFTDALPRLGWLGGAMSIVLMWDRLLDLKRTHPRIHRLYQITVFLNLALIPFALMPFLVNWWVLQIVKAANILNSLNFFISMGLLLVFWSRSRRVELMMYFTAFVIPAFGTLINAGVNMGVLHESAFTSNFYPMAMLVHMLVMSFGLAMRLRQLQYDKTTAEQAVVVAAQRAEEQRRFVAMLSHEFGNPLAAIDRAAQMIQIKVRELPQPELQRLAQIRANAATLAGFVDNFLMTEALDHGALTVSRTPCAIRALLETAIRLQGNAAGERIRLIECPDDATFELDPTLIGIAIGNLLTNALRYAPAGSPIELGATLDTRGLRIRVIDHGPGMTSDEMDKLGTPYFRAASSLGKKGNGLGYHFTRHIVEVHGGTLSAKSQPGAGLEVEIHLAQKQSRQTRGSSNPDLAISTR